MTIDANLIKGFEIGVGVGFFFGLLLGVIILIVVAKQVKLPW